MNKLFSLYSRHSCLHPYINLWQGAFVSICKLWQWTQLHTSHILAFYLFSFFFFVFRLNSVVFCTTLLNICLHLVFSSETALKSNQINKTSCILSHLSKENNTCDFSISLPRKPTGRWRSRSTNCQTKVMTPLYMFILFFSLVKLKKKKQNDCY